jgi:hypothetical protein
MPVFGGTCLALSLIQPLAGHAVVAIKMDDPPKDIQLLPGYKHRRVPTMDTMRGVISKDAGPRIDYEIDANGQNRAAEYPQTAKSIFRTSVKTERMYADVVLDADADTLVVTMEPTQISLRPV